MSWQARETGCPHPGIAWSWSPFIAMMQEYADHVGIKVDGERVWGPRRLRTGNTLSLDSVEPYPIPSTTTTTLWEEDGHGRNDFFGEFMLRIGEDFSFGRNLPYTFSRDRGIVGDARYTLTCRVREC